MKANEAPEKIYLFENPISGTPDDRWLSKRSDENDIEYIRTDAIEVKEVDLEKEFYDFLDTLIGKDNGHLSEDELFRIAEYFFELGINITTRPNTHKEGNEISVETVVEMDAGGYPYIPQIELYDYEKDIPLAKAGDKAKVIVMKGG